MYSGILKDEVRAWIICHLQGNHKRFIKAFFYRFNHFFSNNPQSQSKWVLFLTNHFERAVTRFHDYKIKAIRQSKLNYAAAILSLRRTNLLVSYTRLAKIDDKDPDIQRLCVRPSKRYRYKPFNVFGTDTDLAIRGGPYLSQQDVHTVIFKDAFISGYIEGIIKKKQLWSLIEVDCLPAELGCFQRRLHAIGKTHFLLMHFSFMARNLPKAIFFGANYGYSSNYFHFTVDALPSLLLSLRAAHTRPDGKEFKVLLPTNLHPNIQKIIRAVCAHFGNQIIPLDPNHCVKCKEVIMTGYPSYMAHALPKDVNYSISPVLIRYVRLVLSHVFTQKEAGSSRYYITRKNASGANTSRHVENYQEISDGLSKFGYVTTSAQEMTFDQQLTIFRSAESVVFDGGASLANLVFSPHCKHAFVLAMNKGTDPSVFVSFCQALGIDISYVCGPVVENQEFIDSWQRTYRIEMATLEDAIEKKRIT